MPLFAKILAIGGLTVLSGIFYRMGGSGNYPRWVRPVGCTVCNAMAFVVLGFWHWTMIVAAGLHYGAMTTYWKRKADANWFNWALTGFFSAFANLPVIIACGHWLGFCLMVVANCVLTAAWSILIGRDVVEENGRGDINILTRLFLLIK